MIAAIRYVERNPVRAEIVRVPWDYQWSSARWHTGNVSNDPLIHGGRVLKDLIGDWESYLLDEDEENFVERARTETSVNRPLGGKQFVQQLENRFTQSFMRKKAGRPPRGE